MPHSLCLLTAALLCCGAATAQQAAAQPTPSRALWASINGTKNASLGTYQQHTGKVLVSWRMLPGDDGNTAFDLYRTIGTGLESRVATGIKNCTCYQDGSASKTLDNHYRLTLAGSTETIATYTLKASQASSGQPYVSIPLQPTDNVCADKQIVYQANDCSVGDLDGDGQMEVVVKRLLTVLDGSGNVVSDGTGAGDSDRRTRHCVIWDAYRLDGTLLWRIMSGPNIILGNSSNFAVADLDGDGRCEFITKTGEGTVFGDGTEIGDTDGDGRTDYRDIWPGHYTGASDKGPGGPEFFSVCDGTTGKELARANFISATDRGTTWKQQSESWGDDYWKRANSLRLGVAEFTGKGMQIFLGRGVYARTVVEGWQYDGPGLLTRLWHFDSSTPGGSDTNKDGKPNSAYAGQGNHAFNVADLDGDGLDEVMYGSCAFDNDGTGLWTTGLGHGDANHVGVFQKGYDGLQVYHCLESGKTQVALHDAKTGSTLWQKMGSSDNDMGRCMVADIDAASPGCEFWMYGSNAFTQDGSRDLGYKPASCNMGIWFDGTLLRQLYNENIIHSPANGRTFTLYRYDMGYNNGSKGNPGWYGDMVGDWREEVIVPDATHLKDIKIFATWYPTTHRIPWLMTDHTYLMQCIHQQVGYNQPNNVGYYLASDSGTDAQTWAAAKKAEDDRLAARQQNQTAITAARAKEAHDDGYYTLTGQKTTMPQRGGVYVHAGRKVLMK